MEAGIFSNSNKCYPIMNVDEVIDLLFKGIWKWQGPERIKILLWKMANKGILTNQARLRRGMTDTALFPICNKNDESISHCLRDLKYARECRSPT